MSQHPICSSPLHVAVKWKLVWLGKAAFSLEVFKVGNVLTRGLNLDGEHTYSCNHIKGISKDTAAGESGIKLPDCRGHLDIGDSGDDRHEVSDCEIEDMGQTRKTVLSRVERINVPAVEDCFDNITSGVVVACVVSCNAEELRGG